MRPAEASLASLVYHGLLALGVTFSFDWESDAGVSVYPTTCGEPDAFDADTLAVLDEFFATSWSASAARH